MEYVPVTSKSLPEMVAMSHKFLPEQDASSWSGKYPPQPRTVVWQWSSTVAEPMKFKTFQKSGKKRPAELEQYPCYSPVSLHTKGSSHVGMQRCSRRHCTSTEASQVGNLPTMPQTSGVSSDHRVFEWWKMKSILPWPMNLSELLVLKTLVLTATWECKPVAIRFEALYNQPLHHWIARSQQLRRLCAE